MRKFLAIFPFFILAACQKTEAPADQEATAALTAAANDPSTQENLRKALQYKDPRAGVHFQSFQGGSADMKKGENK